MKRNPRQIMSAAEVKELTEANQSESEIQATVVKSLKALGYEVLVNNAGLRKEAAQALRKVGIKKGAIFQTPGIPDLSVRKRYYKKGFWVLFELKTKKGAMSPAQQQLHDVEGSYLCRSLEEVLAVLREVEQSEDIQSPVRVAA